MAARRKLSRWTWDADRRVVLDLNGRIVAKVPPDSPWGPMIAACPRLLEACEGAILDCTIDDTVEALNACEEAVREATR